MPNQGKPHGAKPEKSQDHVAIIRRISKKEVFGRHPTTHSRRRFGRKGISVVFCALFFPNFQNGEDQAWPQA
jgi:hypothetical protein